MPKTSVDLLAACNDALRAGSDFPTVWKTLLQGHRLVLGVPEQALHGERATLQIRLITGQRLIFDSTAKLFSVA